MITIRIPAPSSMLVANVLGVLGLLAVVAAVGLLAGLAWALLTAGAVMVSLSLIAATHAATAAQAAEQPGQLAEVPRAA